MTWCDATLCATPTRVPLRAGRALRIGLAGCGRIAERAYLPSFQRLPLLRLEAVIDPCEVRRAAFARFVPKGSAFESAEACLDEVELDALVVATPPDAHLRTAMLAVQRGVAVLIEKPLAPGMDGVEWFAAACRAADVVVAVGFNRRFWRPVNDLVHALAQSPRSQARVELFQSSDPLKWSAVSGSPDALGDLAPHQFDLLRYLFGREVASVAARWVDEQCLEFTAEMEDGVEARARVLSRPGCRVRETVSLGAYRIDLRSDRCRPGQGMIRLALDGLDAVGRRVTGHPLSILESHDLQLAAFADCVMNRRMPRASLADGIAAVRCIDAARRSAALGGLRVEP